MKIEEIIDLLEKHFKKLLTDNIDDEDDIIRGAVRITALEKTAPDNAVTTFTVTLTGQGEPFITAAA